MTQLDNGWIGDDWWGRDDGGTPERVLPDRYDDPPYGPTDLDRLKDDEYDRRRVTDDEDDNGTAEPD